MELIDKNKVIAEIERIMSEQQEICKADVAHGEEYPDSKNVEVIYQFQQLIKFIDTLEVKDVDLESENENSNPKIPTGTKIRLKANPGVILSIISNDCHGDEFECSNGSVLSLKQIEKYYDIII